MRDASSIGTDNSTYIESEWQVRHRITLREGQARPRTNLERDPATAASPVVGVRPATWGERVIVILPESVQTSAQAGQRIALDATPVMSFLG
jgi:hypothetical protein